MWDQLVTAICKFGFDLYTKIKQTLRNTETSNGKYVAFCKPRNHAFSVAVLFWRILPKNYII